MIINIEQSDIDTAVRKTADYCLVANAIKRELKNYKFVGVAKNCVLVNNTWYDLSPNTIRLIRDFDSGKSVALTEIEVYDLENEFADIDQLAGVA